MSSYIIIPRILSVKEVWLNSYRHHPLTPQPFQTLERISAEINDFDVHITVYSLHMSQPVLNSLTKCDMQYKNVS